MRAFTLRQVSVTRQAGLDPVFRGKFGAYRLRPRLKATIILTVPRGVPLKTKLKSLPISFASTDFSAALLTSANLGSRAPGALTL
jgi:hypothetical protein